jgi:hypothetical protein
MERFVELNTKGQMLSNTRQRTDTNCVPEETLDNITIAILIHKLKKAAVRA